MPAESLSTVLGDAFRNRYGVAAFNVVNDLTMRAVLTAAQELRAPVIIQTSVKTVRLIGAPVLAAMFHEMARGTTSPVTLHLDHCPDRGVITECIENGWNSVLFDGSDLTIEENQRQTAEVVAEAHARGVQVEGEIEGIQGVEDGVGSDDLSDNFPIDTVVEFIRTTGVDCFAPAIGTSHGMYSEAPQVDGERVSSIVEIAPLPIVLHGGTGLLPAQFEDLISRGCAKINISTALKIAYVEAHREYLEENPSAQDPMKLFAHVEAAVSRMAGDHIAQFGAAGRG
jgi:ketose-bisphosphate aldolase